MPFELYRHDQDIEAQAIRKHCRFHMLKVADLPTDMLLVEIRMSSLGTVGWAFMDVEEWDSIECVSSASSSSSSSSIGGCVV